MYVGESKTCVQMLPAMYAYTQLRTCVARDKKFTKGFSMDYQGIPQEILCIINTTITVHENQYGGDIIL